MSGKPGQQLKRALAERERQAKAGRIRRQQALRKAMADAAYDGTRLTTVEIAELHARRREAFYQRNPHLRRSA